MKHTLPARLPALAAALVFSIAAHAAPGDLDPLNANVVGFSVEATAVQPDGKTIIAGSFTSVLGQPRNNIARINADGTLDAGFNPDAGGDVYSVAVQADGKILLGGAIGSVGGTARNGIARINADGTLDAGFNPKPNSYVTSVVVQADGKILLGGDFSTVGGTGRNYIARLAADGTLDPGFNPNANDRVFSVAVQADGRILFGGRFTTVGETVRNRIARVAADGTLDPGFDPNANNFVRSVVVQADGRILLGGHFRTVGGTERNYIARVATDGTLDPGFNPDANDLVFSVAVQADGKILLGGWFTTVGGTGRKSIARVTTNGTLDAGFHADVNDFILGVAEQADGKILLGGWFTAVGGTGRNLFAQLLNEPATQTLSAPDSTQVLWTRGGSAPEVSQVTFELSTNGGSSFTPLGGTATRVGSTANWQLTGLSLPTSGQLRARGRTTGGGNNASSGLVEAVASFGPGNDTSLIARYPFNGDPLDDTGNGHNGTLFGPAAATDRKGVAGGAYAFDGVNDYIGVPYSAAMQPAVVTLALWAQRDNWAAGSLSDSMALAGNTDSGGYEIYIDKVAGKLQAYVRSRSGSYVTPDTPLATLTPGWHHFALTCDGTNTILYVDGVAADTDTTGDGAVHYTRTNSFIIGAEASSGVSPEGDHFAGKIDEVRVYGRVLSAQEITGLAGFNRDSDSDGLPDAWELTFWPSINDQSALDDFDHDGLVNLMELAFGLNPTLPNGAALPPPTTEGNYLTLTLTKQPGVTYEVQSAGSLLPGQPDSFSAASTTVLIHDATTLKVRDNVPISTALRRMMRVKVTAAP